MLQLPSYAEKLGVINVARLRRMTVPLAREWLTTAFDLTNEELEEALTLARPASVIPVSYTINSELERLGIAAIWLCGASARQLAKLYGVAPQSVAQRLNRIFKQSPRDVAKLHDSMPAWRVEYMMSQWNQMASDKLVGMSPYEVAQSLDQITPKENPEDGGSQD